MLFSQYNVITKCPNMVVNEYSIEVISHRALHINLDQLAIIIATASEKAVELCIVVC
jgi:hypothetical protein